MHFVHCPLPGAVSYQPTKMGGWSLTVLSNGQWTNVYSEQIAKISDALTSSIEYIGLRKAILDSINASSNIACLFPVYCLVNINISYLSKIEVC